MLELKEEEEIIRVETPHFSFTKAWRKTILLIFNLIYVIQCSNYEENRFFHFFQNSN
jgi:hypothetical protein